MNAPFKRRRWALALIAASTLLASCASPTAADYAAEKPQLDLKTYFNGELVAHGLFTDRSGKVVRRFVVQMTGTWQGGQGTLDERFTSGSSPTKAVAAGAAVPTTWWVWRRARPPAMR